MTTKKLHMLLIASALALLVIFAGVKLHLQAVKESLGKMYKCAAWFFIIAGFLIIGCAGICCVAKCMYGAHKMMEKEHNMRHGSHYMSHEGSGGGGCEMMNCNSKMMNCNCNMGMQKCGSYSGCGMGMECKCAHECAMDSTHHDSAHHK